MMRRVFLSVLQAHDKQAAPGCHHSNGARHPGRRDLPEVLPEVRERLERRSFCPVAIILSVWASPLWDQALPEDVWLEKHLLWPHRSSSEGRLLLPGVFWRWRGQRFRGQEISLFGFEGLRWSQNAHSSRINPEKYFWPLTHVAKFSFALNVKQGHNLYGMPFPLPTHK